MTLNACSITGFAGGPLKTPISFFRYFIYCTDWNKSLRFLSQDPDSLTHAPRQPCWVNAQSPTCCDWSRKNNSKKRKKNNLTTQFSLVKQCVICGHLYNQATAQKLSVSEVRLRSVGSGFRGELRRLLGHLYDQSEHARAFDECHNS